MKLLLALTVLLCAGVIAPASALAAAPSLAEEVAAERAEEAAESAEDAAAAPLEAIAPSPLLRRVERQKALIAKYRESLIFTRTLPHSTTRWQEHRPKKRAKIREARERIKALRLAMHEAGYKKDGLPR